MKKTKNFKQVCVGATLLSAVIVCSSSCDNNKRTSDDTKAAAMEQNDVKSDGDAQLEKESKFLVEAAEINLKEIKLGQLAQNMATMSDVKELGKMMEDEHTKCMNELRTLAAQKQITLPTSITNDGQDAYNKLSSKSGSDFDKEYCHMMVNGHKDAISKFEKVSSDCKDPDIKAWATATLPALRGHLDHALNCQKKSESI